MTVRKRMDLEVKMTQNTMNAKSLLSKKLEKELPTLSPNTYSKRQQLAARDRIDLLEMAR